MRRSLGSFILFFPSLALAQGVPAPVDRAQSSSTLPGYEQQTLNYNPRLSCFQSLEYWDATASRNAGAWAALDAGDWNPASDRSLASPAGSPWVARYLPDPVFLDIGVCSRVSATYRASTEERPFPPRDMNELSQRGHDCLRSAETAADGWDNMPAASLPNPSFTRRFLFRLRNPNLRFQVFPGNTGCADLPRTVGSPVQTESSTIAFSIDDRPGQGPQSEGHCFEIRDSRTGAKLYRVSMTCTQQHDPQLDRAPGFGDFDRHSKRKGKGAGNASGGR